jgi:hypothetical protein
MNEDSQLRDLLTELGDEAVGPTTMPSELSTRIARRRRRQTIVASSMGVVALAGAGALVAQLAFSGGGSPSRTVVMPQSDASTPPAVETPTPAVIGGDHAPDCPAALPFGQDATEEARHAVLSRLKELYPDVDTMGATGVPYSAGPGIDGYQPMVVQACGEAVAERTIVIVLDFPEMRPSASLSQGVVFVSRTEAGWTPWRVVR